MNGTDQTITLKDGRTLGFAIYGDPAGTPIFHFNGSGGSRLERPVDAATLTGVCYISTDRPGHGLSTFQPERELLDWPDDIAQLADHLGIGKFHVLGWSAGGPHALACAYKLPDRVLSAALVSGLAPGKRPGALKDLPFQQKALIAIAGRFPSFAYGFRRLMRGMIMKDDFEKVKNTLINSFPEVDKQAALAVPEAAEMLINGIQEGYRPGSKGPALDDIIINNDWGFDISDITVRVDIWQGEIDKNVPRHAAEYQHEHIPNSRVFFLPDEGHLYLLHRWREILEKLVE